MSDFEGWDHGTDRTESRTFDPPDTREGQPAVAPGAGAGADSASGLNENLDEPRIQEPAGHQPERSPTARPRRDSPREQRAFGQPGRITEPPVVAEPPSEPERPSEPPQTSGATAPSGTDRHSDPSTSRFEVPSTRPPSGRGSSLATTAAAAASSSGSSQRQRQPRVMAVANQKGGVGKTTTTVNLGAAAAEMGHRVLVVDLDPQGNASTGLGINPRSLETSMYDVLLQDVPIDEAIEAAEVRNLFVAPANLDLAGAEIELVPAFSRELRLKNALAAVDDDFDLILIDCPPSLGLLTVNAFAAATEVLVPIQCEYYALEGLGQLLRNVDLVKRNLNASLELSAIVLVMYDARTNLANQVAEEVREHFGSKVCRAVIPRNIRLSEAPSFGQPITVFDPSSRGAIAYRDLAEEVAGDPT